MALRPTVQTFEGTLLINPPSLHAQDFLEYLSQQDPENKKEILLKNLLLLSYPISLNILIAKDNLHTKHPHYLKDASNPMFFSHIQFGDENVLHFSGAVPP